MQVQKKFKYRRNMRTEEFQVQKKCEYRRNLNTKEEKTKE